jgi:WD40 repeat protein
MLAPHHAVPHHAVLDHAGRNEGPDLPSSRRLSACRAALVLAIAALGCGSAPPPPPRPAPTSAPAAPEAPKVQLEKRYGTSWFQHGEEIRSVAVTKDGATVLSCGEKSIVAFDAKSGAERQRLSTSCMRFAMAPDASHLAVIGEEALSLYSVGGNGLDPKALWTTAVPKAFEQIQFRELAFSADGKTLGARIGFDDYRAFSAATGKLLDSHGLKTGHPDNQLVAFGPGGRSIVLTSRSPSPGTRLLSFDSGASVPFEAPPRLLTIWEHEGSKVFRWSHDGQLLLGTARLDNPNEELICLWNAATGKLVGSWPFGKERVDAALFSRDEKSVIAVSDDEVWQIDIASGNITKRARQAEGAQDLALSPDGRFLFSGHRDGSVLRWDLSLQADTTPAVEAYSCAAVSSDGALALVGGGNKLVLVDATGEHTLSPPEVFNRVKFSPSGKFIMTGTGALQLWSTQPGRLVGAVPDYVFWPPFALADGWFAFSRYEEWSLYRRTCSADGIKELPPLDLETPCIGGNFAQMALSRDQKRLAIVYGPGFDQDACSSAGPEDWPDNARAKPIPGQPPAPYRLRVYDTKRWSVVATRGASGAQVPSLAMDEEGDVIAIGTASGIELWSSVKRRTLGKIAVNAELARITMIPGRPWLAVGLSSGKVQIHDYESQSLITELNAHPGAVQCLDASETRLVSTGFERTAAVWNLGAAPPKKP